MEEYTEKRGESTKSYVTGIEKGKMKGGKRREREMRDY